MSIAHALLGVLAGGPGHGYDLKREHDERFPGSKPLPYGQVYATLARLERDGLVEVAETARHAGPERTAYAITEAGRRELETWLAVPETAGPYPADELVRKAVTAVRLDADAAGFLAAQRRVHLDRMRELLETQERSEGLSARVALDHTISHLEADLRWLEAAAARVAAAKEAR